MVISNKGEVLENNRDKSYLDYIWISEFRNIKNQGFHFSRKYRYQYDDEAQVLTRTTDYDPKYFVESFFDNNIEVNAVVGKNGCGKTNLLQAIYSCLGDNSLELMERAILVFRDGTVYIIKGSIELGRTRQTIQKKYAVLKFESNCTELRLNWNDNMSFTPDLRCIYHSDVMDFQAIDFCTDDIGNYTNISMSSLLTKYLDNRFIDISGDPTQYKGDARQLIKGFFFEEFGRQLQYYKIISQNNNDNMKLPVPQFATITLKSIDTLWMELQQKFHFVSKDLTALFQPMQNEQNIDGTLYRQFKSKISPCILAGLLYRICFKIGADNGLIRKRGRFNSAFSTEECCFIVLKLLNNIISITKRQIVDRKQLALNAPWVLITEIIECLMLRSEKLKDQLFNNKTRDSMHNSFYRFYLNQRSIKYRSVEFEKYRNELEPEYGNHLDAEIEHDLKVLSLEVKSFYRLIRYLSKLKDISDEIEPSTFKFKINITGENADETLNLDLMEVWNNFRADGIIYDYINFSWNLSSGEYARWALFARIYEHAEIKHLGLDEDYRTLILLLDEADMLLHPEWQRNFVEQIILFAKKMFPQIVVQVIIATHSPIMLSDIPKQNTLFLTDNQQKEPDETFASNIFALYQDSFFLEDSGIGTFAKNKLTDLVTWIREDSHEIKHSNDELVALIESVGDVYLRAKLKNEYNMYRMKESSDSKGVLTKTIIEQRDKIQELEEQLEKYKRKLERASNDKD